MVILGFLIYKLKIVYIWKMKTSFNYTLNGLKNSSKLCKLYVILYPQPHRPVSL